jgi:hypothetical protein
MMQLGIDYLVLCDWSTVHYLYLHFVGRNNESTAIDDLV